MSFLKRRKKFKKTGVLLAVLVLIALLALLLWWFSRPPEVEETEEFSPPPTREELLHQLDAPAPEFSDEEQARRQEIIEQEVSGHNGLEDLGAPVAPSEEEQRILDQLTP